MDPAEGIEIENLAAIRLSSSTQAKKLYRLGRRSRSTASTNSNATSSRSHCLIRILVTCFNAVERRTETSKIWMVDLGGSERLLKTQAKGKRLEEGKAINLSLSALGDVISALQRKKPHIPYRNSKLTQVLRDSLGEGSKTLMLVHVSPKEEDLCETICSLGFATRVRSIQLEHVESAEGKAKKEGKMAELLQKVEQIEKSHLDTKRNIDKLNANLKHLTGTDGLVSEHLQIPQDVQEQQKPNSEKKKHRLKLPRFMRPTVCSRQKSDKTHKAFENTKNGPAVPTKMRKASSLRAESVSFPINGISKSEYGSDVVSLSSKYSADYGIELDVLGYDVKMVGFEGHEKNPSSLNSSISCLSHESIQGEENELNSEIVMDKCLNINNWALLQEKKLRSTFIHQGKQVEATPLPDKNRSDVHNCETVDEKVAEPYGKRYPNVVSRKGCQEDLIKEGFGNFFNPECLPREGGLVVSSSKSVSQDSNEILECRSTPTLAVKMEKDLLFEEIFSNHAVQEDKVEMQKPVDPAPNDETDRENEISMSCLQDNVMHADDLGKPFLHLVKSRRALFMDQTGAPLECSLGVINLAMSRATPTNDDNSKKELSNHDILDCLSEGVGLAEKVSNKFSWEDVKSTIQREKISRETPEDLVEAHEANADCRFFSATGQSYQTDALQLDEADCEQVVQSQRGALLVDHRDVDLEETLMPTLVHIVSVENQNKGIGLLSMRTFQTFCASALLGLGIWRLELEDDFFHALMR